MVKVFCSIKEWRQIQQQDFLKEKELGFVPTMGNIHAGHLSLAKQSMVDNELTLVSIYVNPTQFNNQFDLDNYPITQEQDILSLTQLGVDYIFMPNYESIYSDNFSYQVCENKNSLIMEGNHREGHFTGVLTVLMKFFQLIAPTRVYMGEKDHQQLSLVRGMCEAFFMGIELIACPTVRNQEGLALSSRNSLLSHDQMQLAVEFAKVLRRGDNPQSIEQTLQDLGLKVDYVEQHEGRIYAAVWVDGVRLIDNVEVLSLARVNLNSEIE